MTIDMQGGIVSGGDAQGDVINGFLNLTGSAFDDYLGGWTAANLIQGGVCNDTLLGRGRFRVKGDVLEIQPAHAETAYRVSFFGDEVEAITHFDPLTGEVL